MTTKIDHGGPDPVEAVLGEVTLAPYAEMLGGEADEADIRSESAEEPSFESPVDQVMTAVTRQPLHREILYKTLGFCRERRGLTEVEEEIAGYPEFKYATQNQFRLISFLTNAGGLERIELDDEGETVTEDRKAGLTEDEIDDLVASYAYVTTDAGATVFEEFDPRRRILELLGIMPEHEDTFASVLEFCATSRTYSEIEELLEAADKPWSGSESDEDEVHPSYFVTNLERVGAIVWSDGWRLSDEGKAILEGIREK